MLCWSVVENKRSLGLIHNFIRALIWSNVLIRILIWSFNDFYFFYGKKKKVSRQTFSTGESKISLHLDDQK